MAVQWLAGAHLVELIMERDDRDKQEDVGKKSTEHQVPTEMVKEAIFNPGFFFWHRD